MEVEEDYQMGYCHIKVLNIECTVCHVTGSKYSLVTTVHRYLSW